MYRCLNEMWRRKSYCCYFLDVPLIMSLTWTHFSDKAATTRELLAWQPNATECGVLQIPVKIVVPLTDLENGEGPIR